MGKGGFLVKKVLRLKDEPCLYFKESEIHGILFSKGVRFMDELKRFYGLWHKRSGMVEMPPKKVFVTKGVAGDFRVMPCVVKGPGKRLIKAVKVIGTDIEQTIVKDKISVGKALLLHPKDNIVEAIFDVGALTSFRTAAATVLAHHYLAGPSKGKIGIIGAGRIGFYTLQLLYQWTGAREVLVEDPNGRHLAHYLRAARRVFHKLKIREGSLDDLCAECGAIFLATTTRRPILSEANAGPVRFISSIGADSNSQSELDPSILRDRRIFTDSKTSIHFADLKRWEDRGLIRERDITELRLVAGERRGKYRKTLFISTGIALHDALVCQFLFENLNKK